LLSAAQAFSAAERATDIVATNTFVGALVCCSTASAAVLIALLEYAKSAAARSVAGAHQASLARAAAAVVAVVVGLLAVKPALYCLAFATATWTRVGIVAYWLVLMGVSLPVMHHVAQSDTIPNILGGSFFKFSCLGAFCAIPRN
jgi:hypothetical protein